MVSHFEDFDVRNVEVGFKELNDTMEVWRSGVCSTLPCRRRETAQLIAHGKI